jgi:hypothetical protein
MKLPSSVALIFLGAFLFLAAPPLSAAEPFDPDALSITAVNPGNDLVLSNTPRFITVNLDNKPQSAAALKTIKLIRAISGNEIPPAGTPTLNDNLLSFPPPSLEAGTYIISWRTGGLFFTNEHRSVFSIGSPDTSVTGSNITTISAISWPSRALGVILSLFSGFLIARRRNLLASLTSVFSLISFSFALLPSGFLPTLIAAPGLVTLGILVAIALSKSSASILLVFSILALLGSLLVILSGLLSAGIAAFGSITWVATSLLVIGLTLLAVAISVVGFAASRRGAMAGRALASVVTVAALFAGLLSVLSDPSGGTVLGGRALQLNANVKGCLADGNVQDHRYCLEQLYTSKVEALGVPAALNDLAQETKANPILKSYCHETSHAIGRAALRVLGSVGSAFETGFDVCDFGYYHGIIEGAGGSLDDEAFRTLLPTLCAELASSSLIFFEQCAHGLGHAAARRANNDMVRGLEFCEELDNAKVFTESRRFAALLGCGTGVTMEWFATRGLSTSDRNDFLPIVNNPRDACEELRERWKSSCYEYIGNLVNASNPLNSLAEIATWCNSSSYSEPCFKGIARAASGLRLSYPQAISLCERAEKDSAQLDCASMLLYSYAVTSEYDITAVDRLCALYPAKWDPEVMCATLRKVVVDSLTGVRDGKGSDRIS